MRTLSGLLTGLAVVALLAGCAGKAAGKKDGMEKQAPPPSPAVAPVKAAEPAPAPAATPLKPVEPAPKPAPPKAAGFTPDEEGYIKNWLLLGPIALDERALVHEEESEKDFFNKEFFTNQWTATPRNGDKVTVAGSSFTWKQHQAEETVDFEEAFGDIDETARNTSLFLGVTYIVCDRDYADVSLSIGSDDSSTWRLDGKEIIRVFAARPLGQDQDTSERISLKKGVHVLSFSVINGDGPTGACAHFYDSMGSPVTGFTVTLTPPEGK